MHSALTLLSEHIFTIHATLAQSLVFLFIINVSTVQWLVYISRSKIAMGEQ